MTTVKRAVVDKGRSLTSFSSHRAPSLENHSRLITSKRKLANAQTIRFGCLFASLIFTISPQWSAKGVSSLGWGKIRGINGNISFMLAWIIPLAILIFFEGLADIFAKEWSLGERSFTYAILSLLCYLLANSSWLIALKFGSGLARGAIIFSGAKPYSPPSLNFFITKNNSLRSNSPTLAWVSSLLFFCFGNRLYKLRCTI